MTAVPVSSAALGPLARRLQEKETPPPGPGIESRITSVRWGVTVNLGNYESARLDVEAAVPTGGSPESTLEDLREWVTDHAPAGYQEMDRLSDVIRQRREEARETQQLAEAAEFRWQQIKRFFEDNGLELPQRATEDLPF